MRTRTYQLTDAEVDLIRDLLNQEIVRCQDVMVEYDLGLKNSDKFAEAEGNDALAASALDIFNATRRDD
jgi:hypothetical protein